MELSKDLSWVNTKRMYGCIFREEGSPFAKQLTGSQLQRMIPRKKYTSMIKYRVPGFSSPSPQHNFPLFELQHILKAAPPPLSATDDIATLPKTPPFLSTLGPRGFCPIFSCHNHRSPVERSFQTSLAARARADPRKSRILPPSTFLRRDFSSNLAGITICLCCQCVNVWCFSPPPTLSPRDTVCVVTPRPTSHCLEATLVPGRRVTYTILFTHTHTHTYHSLRNRKGPISNTIP